MALITEKSIFIHIQKTAGMTVRRALHFCSGIKYESGPIQAEMHLGIPELLAGNPGVEAGRFIFGFVRNPVDWIRSRWAYGVASGYHVHCRHRPKAAVLWLNAVWDDNLETFVEKYLERYPGIISSEMFRRLGIWTGQEADFIGRVENLVPDILEALTRAGEIFNPADIKGLGVINPSGVAGDIQRRLRSRIIQAECTLVERFYPDLA